MKRIVTLLVAGLVAVSSVGISYGGTAYAQALPVDPTPITDIVKPELPIKEDQTEVPKDKDKPEKVVPEVKVADPINLDALKEPKVAVDQATQTVVQKSVAVQKTTQEVQTIEQQKQSLASTISSNEQEIATLKQQLADKKAKQEADRQAAVAAQTAAEAPQRVQTTYTYSYTAQTVSYSYSDNAYEPGQCTWHVKNLKPDLPNNLGNADQWYWNAQAMGYPSGTVAQVGAAATRKVGMHAVYVLAVYGDGTMLVSEMNYNWVPFAQRTSIKNQSDFYYIY